MERRLHHLYQTVAQSPDYRVLAGVEELLPQMLEQGYLLGLVTGNVEAAAHIKLHRSRLNRFFSFGGYGSDSTDRGELTRMALQRAAVVSGGSVTPTRHSWSGTPHDVAAAHAAGIPCVGVTSHHFNAEELKAGGADWVIDSLTDGLPL
jgi:phosphoglycolate phosphatase